MEPSMLFSAADGNWVTRSLSSERIRTLKRRLPFVMGTAFSAAVLSTGFPRLPSVASAQSLPLPAATLVTRAGAEAGEGAALEASCEVSVSPETQSYRVDGFFTGVRSSVVVPQPAEAVFESLSRDLQLIFGPIQECCDKRQEGDGRGWERLHRDVKIPFTISYFSNSIRLKMEVENNRSLGQIDFKSLTKGRFLSGFEARFYVQPVLGPDGLENTAVHLDSRIAVKKLPPPPLKGLVKGVIVKKMDACMRDLATYHAGRPRGAGSRPHVLQFLANNIQPSTALRRMLSTERRMERRSLL